MDFVILLFLFVKLVESFTLWSSAGKSVQVYNRLISCFLVD